MPKSFVDPTPQQDSGMNPDDLMSYIEELQHLQQQYAQDIRIRIGLEVDYIKATNKKLVNSLIPMDIF